MQRAHASSLDADGARPTRIPRVAALPAGAGAGILCHPSTDASRWEVSASPAGDASGLDGVHPTISDNGAACEATEPNHAAVESLDRDLHER
jgi:hypothetical protein